MDGTVDKYTEKSCMHKVGVKILSDTQLKNILPTYENLFAKIEDCRSAAYNELNSRKDSKRHYQDNFMYDNVFSILGKRGTGKTSVAFTLQKKIRDNKEHSEYDVVLPLIIPEVIPENCTVLGWILAIVKEEIRELEERICKVEKKSRGEQYRSRYRYSEGKDTEDSLVDKFEEISQMFFAGSYNPSNEMSYYRAVGNSVKQAEDYYRFAMEIAELWDAWIDKIKYCYDLETKKGQDTICPMIYFIFDDVDLAPEKISELLSAIIKYLSHPNIIVITTADERLFLEVIENQLDKKIGRLPGEWRDFLKRTQENPEEPWEGSDKRKRKDHEDVVNQTAAMYLGKVLPPSTRYYLRMFHTAKQKENFFVEDRERLGTAIYNQINELVGYIGGDCTNFMMENNTFINFYIKFIGDTSRQISNTYIALRELVSSLKRIVNNVKQKNVDKSEQLYELYLDCRYFLCVAINSNHELTRAVGSSVDFVDEVFLREYNQWKIYINYSYIDEYVEENVEIDAASTKEEDKALRVEVILQLYSLFAFVENILVLMEAAFPGRNMRKRKVHAVTPMTEYMQRMVFDNRHFFRNDLPANLFFEHYSNMLDRLPSIVLDNKKSDRKFGVTYFYDFRNYNINRNGRKQEDKILPSMEDIEKAARRNPGWFREMVGMLMMVYGNAYLFDKSEMADCLVFREKKYMIRYQQKICNELQEYMNTSFECTKLHEVWIKEKWKENLEKSYLQPDKNDTGFSEVMQKVKNDIIRELNEEEKANSDGKPLLVDLSLVLETVFKHIKSDNYISKPDNLQNLINKCPHEIAQGFVQGLKDIPNGRTAVRKMLAERIANIDRFEYAWKNKGMLFDIGYTSEIFEELFRVDVTKYGELKKIGAEIIASSNLQGSSAYEEEQTEKVFIDMSMFRRLTNTLGQVLDKNSDSRYVSIDEDVLIYEAKELFSGWDISVDIYNRDELKRAVWLGIEIVLVELLQRIYLYQTVYEKYTNNHSLSSRDLERIGHKNTYYYNFFTQLNDICENKQGHGSDVNLREKIESSYKYERQRYVESLIAGVKDE